LPQQRLVHAIDPPPDVLQRRCRGRRGAEPVTLHVDVLQQLVGLDELAVRGHHRFGIQPHPQRAPTLVVQYLGLALQILDGPRGRVLGGGHVMGDGIALGHPAHPTLQHRVVAGQGSAGHQQPQGAGDGGQQATERSHRARSTRREWKFSPLPPRPGVGWITVWRSRHRPSKKSLALPATNACSYRPGDSPRTRRTDQGRSGRGRSQGSGGR